MPEISRFYGIVIYMFYNEHGPPHFHAKYREHEAVIDIETEIIKGEMPRKALNLIYDWVDIHKDEQLDNWKLVQERKPLFKIEPLK